MRVSKADQHAAIQELRTMLPPGSTVTTVLRHVSKSGMSRDIDCFKLRYFGEDHHAWLSRLIGKATGGHMLRDKQDALRVSGCRMDMGFAIVWSHALYPDRFGCIGEGCPSDDHSNSHRGGEVRALQRHERGDWSMPHCQGIASLAGTRTAAMRCVSAGSNACPPSIVPPVPGAASPALSMVAVASRARGATVAVFDRRAQWTS